MNGVRTAETNATYNDGKRGFVGWNADEEIKPLEYITFLHENGFNFILFNVIYHNENTNYRRKINSLK